MNRRAWIPLGLHLAASACANPPPQDVPEQPAPVVNRVSFANGTTTYELTSRRSVEQDIGGQTSRIQNVVRLRISATIAGSAEMHSVQFMVDSVIDAEGPGFTPAMRHAVTGLALRGELDSTGAVTGLQAVNERSTLMARVTTAIKRFFPLIPPDGVAPGMEWVDTTAVVADDGATRITVTSIVHSTSGEWVNNTELPIHWRDEYLLQGEGQQMGQKFSLEGSGLRVGEHTLSADGVYLATSARDSSNAEVSLPALGITVPILQVGVDSVKVVQ